MSITVLFIQPRPFFIANVSYETCLHFLHSCLHKIIFNDWLSIKPRYFKVLTCFGFTAEIDEKINIFKAHTKLPLYALHLSDTLGKDGGNYVEFFRGYHGFHDYSGQGQVRKYANSRKNRVHHRTHFLWDCGTGWLFRQQFGHFGRHL